MDLHTKCCFGQTWPLWEILLIQIHSNWNGLSWQELQLPGAKSFAWCNVFFFFTPSFLFVCFPILVFGLLFVSSHVGLYLIIVLLFLCQQFIPLPCHLIMCCVNSALLQHHSLLMMLLSGLLTCVDVCSFIGITSQVNTVGLGLCTKISAACVLFHFLSFHNSSQVTSKLALPIMLHSCSHLSTAWICAHLLILYIF